ncbi:hypothetical protein [Trichothermofontia sp.]
MQVPYYGVFDRYENDFRLLRLHEGCYEPMALMEPRYWFPELGLGLGVWQGAYDGVEGSWLRGYDAEGNWVPTPRKQSAVDRLRAEQASRRAEQKRERAERLAARLRALGIDPEAEGLS